MNADGSLHLLGRGSVCINTGGEKVFPEEVEEALKTHPAVRDAVAVGLPDARFGETICAVVEAEEGADAAHARGADRPRAGTRWRRTRRRATSWSSTRSVGPRTARSTTSG